MEKYLLGIDVGTTGTKTLLFSSEGKLLGHAYEAYPMYTDRPGWSEQNADDWWNAVCKTVRSVCADPETAANVSAVCLSVQGGTLVPTDKDFHPLRRAIVWNDTRCGEEQEAFLREVGGNDAMYQRTGWNLSKGLLPMQIRWIRNNEPEVFEKTAWFLSVPDYICAKMTGMPAIDLSNIGINEMGDIRKGDYDDTLLGFCGAKREQLPVIIHSGEVIGHLTETAAEELGLSTACILVGGAHDQYAVALGAGANKDGDILIGSGTAWVVTAIADEPDFSSGLAQSVAAVPGKWGTLWSLSTGGLCLEWWRRGLAVGPEDSRISYHEINEHVSQRKAAEEGLFYYPFSGVCSPDRKMFSKASFVGLDLSHDRFHMARAIMEGVAFQIKWMMEAFKAKPSQQGLKLAGGASKSPVWGQLVADITGLPVRIPEVADLACVGAAILAGVGCGIYRDAEEGCRRLTVNECVLMPDRGQVEAYSSRYALYKRNAAYLMQVYDL